METNISNVNMALTWFFVDKKSHANLQRNIHHTPNGLQLLMVRDRVVLLTQSTVCAIGVDSMFFASILLLLLHPWKNKPSAARMECSSHFVGFWIQRLEST